MKRPAEPPGAGGIVELPSFTDGETSRPTVQMPPLAERRDRSKSIDDAFDVGDVGVLDVPDTAPIVASREAISTLLGMGPLTAVTASPSAVQAPPSAASAPEAAAAPEDAAPALESAPAVLEAALDAAPLVPAPPILPAASATPATPAAAAAAVPAAITDGSDRTRPIGEVSRSPAPRRRAARTTRERSSPTASMAAFGDETELVIGAAPAYRGWLIAGLVAMLAAAGMLIGYAMA